MALFQSGNPTLSQKIFDKSRTLEGQMNGTMTVRGTINKFGFLLFMVIAGAAYTWNLYYTAQPATMMTFFWVGLIGGLVAALVISFKPNLAKYLAPAYAILEGLVIGGLSAIVNDAVSQKYPGIIMQAVGLTFGVAIVVFLLYNFRIIRPTQKFKAVIITASVGILFFYLIWMVLSLFGVNVSFMSWNDSSMLGIGINLFVAVIAALSLILDFERIEVGADMGAPKQMEWYGAFGLLVTMIWLYIQILKLLSRFASRR
ncbi:MAG TPA: Bax inhibitor-1/YccA family protein [Chitinophagaceae bacterium]|nr:Bax inhibitor-1/YccA family protein [Chitinophagaceae bacterium]